MAGLGPGCSAGSPLLAAHGGRPPAAVLGLLAAVTSAVANRLQSTGSVVSAPRNQLPRGTWDPPGPGGSSPLLPCVSSVTRWLLYHRATGEALS